MNRHLWLFPLLLLLGMSVILELPRPTKTAPMPPTKADPTRSRAAGPTPALTTSATPTVAPPATATATAVPSPAPYCGLDWQLVGGALRISAAEDDVWASGPAGVLRWGGRSWASVPAPYNGPTGAISVAAANEVWVLGSSPYYTLHWNGVAWINPAFPVPTPALSISLADIAARPGHAWVVGAYEYPYYYFQPLLRYWDGTAWQAGALQEGLRPAQPAGGCQVGNWLSRVDAVGQQDAWIIGSYSTCTTLVQYYQHCVAANCSDATLPIYAEAFAGVADNDAWAVGSPDNTFNGSALAHWDGSRWTVVPVPDIGPLTVVAARAADDVWAGSDNRLLHWDGSAWTTVTATYPPMQLAELELVGTTEIWVGGRDYSGNPVTYHYSDPSQFTDVPATYHFYPYIHWVACQNIVSGYGCGGLGEPCPGPYFRPGNNVTRGQMLKMVVAASGWTILMPATPTFEDVPPLSTFYPYVETGVNHGIIGGYPCGGAGEPCVAPGNQPYFRPNAPITRGQLSKVIALAKGYPTPSPPTATFNDVPVGSTFFAYVEAVHANGLIVGYPCGGVEEPCPGSYFRPNANATRAQVIKIVTLAYGGP